MSQQEKLSTTYYNQNDHTPFFKVQSKMPGNKLVIPFPLLPRTRQSMILQVLFFELAKGYFDNKIDDSTNI